MTTLLDRSITIINLLDQLIHIDILHTRTNDVEKEKETRRDYHRSS